MLIDDRIWKCYFNILAVFTDHGHNGVWCENVVLFDYDPVHKTRTSFFPKLISEQCESRCTRQIIFENPPEPTLGFYSGTECLVTC